MSAQVIDERERHQRIKARKMLTYLAIFAIVMFFAGLLSAYIVSSTGGYWVQFTLPEAFIYSTVAIVAGSVTVHLALLAARRGSRQPVVIWLALTLALGLAFTWSQFNGWQTLIERGITLNPNWMLKFSGTYGVDHSFMKNQEVLVLENGSYYMPDDLGHARPLNAELEDQRDRTGPYLYALTGLHLAHLAFGLLAVVVMLVTAARGRYGAEDNVGLWAGALYWHFLGGLWVFLLLFLSIVH